MVVGHSLSTRLKLISRVKELRGTRSGIIESAAGHSAYGSPMAAVMSDGGGHK